MSKRLSQREYDATNPLVVQNADGKFLQGKRWVSEYPDADKFAMKGAKKKARDAAQNNRGKLVAYYGQNDETVLADYTPKPWLMVTTKGSFHLPESNLSELDVPEGITAADIKFTHRVLDKDDKPVSADDTAINDAVRTIIQRANNAATALPLLNTMVKEFGGDIGRAIVLLSDNGEAPFILPALINGAIEYQVSDAIDGERSESWDAYTWSEALKYFAQMRAELIDKRRNKPE